MENRKTTLDREPISSKEIKGRQNLNQVLKGHQALKPPLWKSVWFYGPVGIATVTLIVAAGNMNIENESNVTAGLEHSIDRTEQFQLAQTQFFSEPNKEVVSKKNVEKESQVETPDVQKPLKSATPTATEKSVVKEEPAITETPSSIKEEIVPVVVTRAPKEEVKVAKRMKTMPNVGGVFTGRIRVDEICNAGKISCNNDYTVYSYDIHYSNGAQDVVERVRGNRFPPYMCANIRDFNVGQMIFITNIIAKNSDGDVERLISMNLEPTF